MNITFENDGSAHCLYGEEIPITCLGQLTITRASTIEFEHISQCWEVVVNGKTVYRDVSRQACLQWEKANLD